MNSENHKLIQDWTDYNKSIIWDISNRYYKETGIKAFSSESNRAIPHEVTSNYQGALAFAELVKTNLNLYKKMYKKDTPIKILDCGAGNGYFSRNLLYALQELKILDNVLLLISDYSKTSLEDMRKTNMFADFTEEKHYKFIELDVLNIDAAKDINGQAFEIKNIGAIALNYVLDVLPLTVLKKKYPSHQVPFEEMRIKILHKESSPDFDEIEDTNLTENIEQDVGWANYHFEEQGGFEKDCKEYLLEFHKDTVPGSFVLYAYGALQACRSLLEHGDDNSFLLASDIPKGKIGLSKFFGNTLAHEVDTKFIGDYLTKYNNHYCDFTDKLLSRLLVCKNQESKNILEKVFEEKFIKNNLTNRYADLRSALAVFEHKEALDCMKYLLDEFTPLAKHSLYIHLFWGRYYEILGDLKKAAEEYKKVEELDFTNSYKTFYNVNRPN